MRINKYTLINLTIHELHNFEVHTEMIFRALNLSQLVSNHSLSDDAWLENITKSLNDLECVVNTYAKDLEYHCKLILSNPWVLYNCNIVSIDSINIILSRISTVYMYLDNFRRKIVEISVMKNLIDN